MKKQDNRNFELNVNPLKKDPLYWQVKSIIQLEILSGRFAKGFKLPSINSLVKDNIISAITVERAYRLLQKEGLVERKIGFGYYVAEDEFTNNQNS